MHSVETGYTVGKKAEVCYVAQRAVHTHTHTLYIYIYVCVCVCVCVCWTFRYRAGGIIGHFAVMMFTAVSNSATKITLLSYW